MPRTAPGACRTSNCWRRCWACRRVPPVGALRLLNDTRHNPETLGEGAQAFILRETAMPDMEALTGHLADLTAAAAQLVAAALPPARKPEG